MHHHIRRCALGLVVAAAAVSAGGCLLGTAPVPYEPGLESLPQASINTREQIILNQLMTIKTAETFRYAERGSYATLDELVSGGHLNYNPTGLKYQFELKVTDGGKGYEIVAVPNQYGPDGRRSFYMNQSGVIRGDDHQGGAPSKDDPAVQPM
jgi:hypothetical protein